MKKSLKVLISTICAFVFVALLGLGIFAVKDYREYNKYMKWRFLNDAVAVYISSDYLDEFLSKEFEIEDFELNNIERIKYGYWSEGDNCGKITVYLKKPGWVRVNRAIKRLEELPFVKDADYVPGQFLF